jgi:hypothetical protein
MENLNKMDYSSQNDYLSQMISNTDRNHYLFSLSKKTKNTNNIQPNNKKTIVQKSIIQKIIEGPTGPSGKDGDRFCTKTTNKIRLNPTRNSIIAINVEPGLSYISGNSVIVAEVPNHINDELNTFEGIVQYYSKLSGQIIIKDISNIHGEFKTPECYYHVNLDGIDGEQGPPGPPGPTGASYTSETSLSLILLENTITIPEQVNQITYYTLNINNNDEIKGVQSNLKNNQTSIILINLSDLQENDTSVATIYTMYNNSISINYDKNIVLNQDIPFAMFKIYNIHNNIFLESVSYYKNNYISL